MSPAFLLLPGVARWELVAVPHLDRPLLSGRLTQAPAARQLAGPTPSTQESRSKQ